MLGGLGEGVDALLAADEEHVAIECRGDGALVDEDITPRLDGVLTGLLHREAHRSGEGLAVVERDRLEHELRDVGRVGLSQGLRAPRA